jgi:hypothetical protein
MRDAFALDQSWLQTGPADGNRQPLPPEEAFAANHRLQAVMLAGPRGGAQVNGLFMTVGQSIGGFRLVEVGEQSAVFESGSRRVVLELQDDR